MSLAGHGLREQGLAGTGRANQKRAFRQLGSDLRVLLGVVQEADQLLQGLLGLILARDVAEGNARVLLHIVARLALADVHHPAGAAHPVHEDAEHDHEEDDRDQEAQDGGDDLRHHRGLLRLVGDAGVLKPLRQFISVLDGLGVIADGRLPLLRLRSDLDRACLENDGLDLVPLQHLDELVVGDLLGVSPVQGPRKKAHAGKSEQYAYKKNEERLPVPVAVVPALIIVVLIVIHNTSRDRQTVTVHYKKSGA